MAKINDLKRLVVIDELYNLQDVNGNFFLHVSELVSFRIQFGLENSKTHFGRVKVSASCFYEGKKFDFTFFGNYSHLMEFCEFKSVQIEKEFQPTLLLSTHENKILRSWLLEDVGVEIAVEESAGVCPEEADDDSAIKLPYVQHFVND